MPMGTVSGRAGIAAGNMDIRLGRRDLHNVIAATNTGDENAIRQDLKQDVKAGLTFRLGRNLGLQAGTQFYFPLSPAARRAIDGHSYNINGHLASALVFGTTLTCGF